MWLTGGAVAEYCDGRDAAIASPPCFMYNKWETSKIKQMDREPLNSALNSWGLHVVTFLTFLRTEHTPYFTFSYFWLATAFCLRSMELGFLLDLNVSV